jgi:hypothetical protein
VTLLMVLVPAGVAILAVTAGDVHSAHDMQYMNNIEHALQVNDRTDYTTAVCAYVASHTLQRSQQCS